MKKKLLALLLLVCMSVSVLAGCGGTSGNEADSNSADVSKSSTANASDSNAKTGEANTGSGPVSDLETLDMSDHVDLSFVLFGSISPDHDMIMEKVNEITEEKLNCSVDVSYVSDLDQYSMMLATGEPFDLIWTASWNSCFSYAQQGAYMDITDIVNQQFPYLKSVLSKEEYWDQIAVNGKYYLVPCHFQETANSWGQWGVVWREDLRKELGCEEIKDWETMEAFAKAIVDADLGMIPFKETIAGGLFHSVLEKDHLYTEFGGYSNTLGLDLDTLEIVDFVQEDSIREYCETIRRWEKNGYVEPDIASNTDNAVESFLAGKYAGSMCGVVIDGYVNNYYARAKELHPDWELKYLNFGSMFEFTYRNSPANGGVAVPSNSKHPERALAFIELLLTDNELYRLLEDGIEGVHYELDENGNYRSLQGANSTWLRNSFFLSTYYVNYDASIPDEYTEMKKEIVAEQMEPYEITAFWPDFPYDESQFSEYTTAGTTIRSQYWVPLLTGAVEDIDGTIQQTIDAMKGNGMEYITAAITEQWNAYVEEKGIVGLNQQ